MSEMLQFLTAYPPMAIALFFSSMSLSAGSAWCVYIMSKSVGARVYVAAISAIAFAALVPVSFIAAKKYWNAIDIAVRVH